MKLSASVIIYQAAFFIVQYFAFYFKGKQGLVISYVLILFWSLSKTFNSLLIFQVIIQTIFFIYLLAKNKNILKQ